MSTVQGLHGVPTCQTQVRLKKTLVSVIQRKNTLLQCRHTMCRWFIFILHQLHLDGLCMCCSCLWVVIIWSYCLQQPPACNKRCFPLIVCFTRWTCVASRKAVAGAFTSLTWLHWLSSPFIAYLSLYGISTALVLHTLSLSLFTHTNTHCLSLSLPYFV